MDVNSKGHQFESRGSMSGNVLAGGFSEQQGLCSILSNSAGERVCQ